MALKSSTVARAIKKDNHRRSHIEYKSGVEQVRDLAWAGQHTQAVELATQTLSLPKLKPTEQMNLLDLRAESYIAQGKLDLAFKDANAMVKLAKASQKLKAGVLQSQALNRKAFVQIRMGELKNAAKSAKSALKIAQQFKQKELTANSLLSLSEVQFRAGDNEGSVESAQEAIALFHSIKSSTGTGRAYWSLASACQRLGRAAESRTAAYLALELSQQAGDQFGIGNAYNVMTFTDNDIAERITHLQLAIRSFEKAGYVERQALALRNLGVAYYFDLGLYSHARRLFNEATEINREMGAKLNLAISLDLLIVTEITLGIFDSARTHLSELAQLAPTLGVPFIDTILSASYGYLDLTESRIKSAIRQFKKSVALSRKVGQAREIIDLTLLGQAYLASGNFSSALRATQKATELHRAQSFAKPTAYTSQIIWWRHTQALTANKKTVEALEALDLTFDFLLESIRNIRDVGFRRNSLNKVLENREIIQFWVQQGTKRKLSK